MRKKSILLMLLSMVAASILLSSCGISITRNYNYYYPKKSSLDENKLQLSSEEIQKK